MYHPVQPIAPQAPVTNQRKRGGTSNGETSCAECRRSKQRCDKQWPCSNCRKRGCAAICPDGEIQPSSEKEARKFNTKLLQRQTALEAQVEQLTNELKVLKQERRSVSLASSPALSPPGSLTAEHSSNQDRSRSSASTDHDRRDNDHAGETGGILRLQKDGESIYIGAGGSSWALQQAVTGQEAEVHPSYARTHHSNHQSCRDRPKPLMDSHAQIAVTNILSTLPNHEEAKNLVRMYFRYVDWLYCVVSERQIWDDLPLLFVPCEEGISYPVAQRMAVVAAVLALGALFSPGRSLASNQPWHCYNAARQLLDYGLYLRHFTLPGVQTLHLSVSFLANNRDSYLAQEGWVLLGTAGRLAQAQGLHVDGSKWDLPSEELESRRRVFWELQTYDRLQALSQGRPVFAPLSSCTTEQPMNVNPFDQQKYALAPLCERILAGISSPDFRYSEALSLDRRVREIEGQAPSALRSGMFSRLNRRQDTLGPHEPEPLANAHTIVQRHMHTLIVHKALLFLHRPWLGHILSQKLTEPLNSCFGISFSASIASAEALVENMSSALAECPHEARSFWFFMFHTFSAVVVLAACILRAPQSLHVLRTWEALEVAVQIFVDWPLGDDDHFVRRALPIVTQLLSKVRNLLGSTSQDGVAGEEHNWRLRELLGFRSTAAGQSRPGSPVPGPSPSLAPEQSQQLPAIPSLSSLPPIFPGTYPNQPLEWDPSVLSLQNLPQMDLDSLLAGDAFQGDYVTQGLDWIFEL